MVDAASVCFDDAPWAPFIDPPISVIAQDAYRMGTNAASMLIGRIGGAMHPPRRLVLGADLVVREDLVASLMVLGLARDGAAVA